MEREKKIIHAANYLQKYLANNKHVMALVLGSGLGGFIRGLQPDIAIPYSNIPHFPLSTIKGHQGCLYFCKLEKSNIIILSGRVHLYEGYSPFEVVFSIRALGSLGIKNIILTNAAGALNPQFDVGSIMLITDHINMTGQNPLTGPNIEEWGPRFPDMSQVYCPKLQKLAREAARKRQIHLERGIYVCVPGPSLETPAETRAFRRMGADAIGMSTVMEAIAAKHMGMSIIGLSCLTNKNLPDCMAETSHEEILEQARITNDNLSKLLLALIPEICLLNT